MDGIHCIILILFDSETRLLLLPTTTKKRIICVLYDGLLLSLSMHIMSIFINFSSIFSTLAFINIKCQFAIVSIQNSFYFCQWPLQIANGIVFFAVTIPLCEIASSILIIVRYVFAYLLVFVALFRVNLFTCVSSCSFACVFVFVGMILDSFVSSTVAGTQKHCIIVMVQAFYLNGVFLFLFCCCCQAELFG